MRWPNWIGPNKKLILNISAYGLEEMRAIVQRIEQQLQPQELILQIGFQAYPTKLEDSALSKIAILKEAFPNYAISYTEHVDGKEQASTELPVIAAMLGAEYLEKHIMHSTLHTEYDHYSSVVLADYQQYMQRLERYIGLLDQPFINAAEQQYLDKTLQIPILKTDKRAGECLSITQDLEFKRSNKTGLNVLQVQELLANFHLLRHDKKAGDTLEAIDFKRANIAIIVACRMKSSRLPEKAILPIGDLPSVEVCLKNALSVENVNQVILATSDVEQDAVLEEYTYHDDVIFHKGHPEDVIERYLDVAEPRDVDVIVRITADCPYVSNEVIQHNLKAHFAAGADYTSAPTAAVGTNAEIINTTALRRVKEFFPSANYSEYMTFYFMNNPQHFRLNIVDLPDQWVRDYRLTLDYQEDLDLFNAIAEHFDEKNIPYTLTNIINYLDENPDKAAINGSIGLVYKTDQKLIDTLNEHTTIKD